MSSHREAPQISKDPTADSTDLYAFVSPDKPSTVTLIANYIPSQRPDGGPNFYEFADDVRLRHQHRQRRRRQGQHRLPLPVQDGEQHPVLVPLQRRTDHAARRPGRRARTGTASRPSRSTRVDYPKSRSGDVHGPGHRSCSCRRATSVRCRPRTMPRVPGQQRHVRDPAVQRRTATPARSSPASAPRASTSTSAPSSTSVTCGRSRRPAPVRRARANMPGVNSTADVNVHSLAFRSRSRSWSRAASRRRSTTASNAVIGVWTTASRRKVTVNEASHGENVATGPYVQVSRLGNPLVNEVIIAIERQGRLEPPRADLGRLGRSSSTSPTRCSRNCCRRSTPASSRTWRPTTAPTTGPRKSNAARPDLVAILLSGIPNGVTSGLGAPPTNVGGTAWPTCCGSTSPSRRPIRAASTTSATSAATRLASRTAGGSSTTWPRSRCGPIAGATLPLVEARTPPTAPPVRSRFGLTTDGSDTTAKGTENYLSSFPYLGTPYSGFATPSATMTGSTG